MLGLSINRNLFSPHTYTRDDPSASLPTDDVVAIKFCTLLLSSGCWLKCLVSFSHRQVNNILVLVKKPFPRWTQPLCSHITSLSQSIPSIFIVSDNNNVYGLKMMMGENKTYFLAKQHHQKKWERSRPLRSDNSPFIICQEIRPLLLMEHI